MRKPPAGDGELTHVVVVASRFGNSDGSLIEAMIQRQRHVRTFYLPAGRNALVVVDNNSPSAAATVLASACQRADLVYTRNEQWALGFGYELGAWRWAILKELPRLLLAREALVYLTQDSVTLSETALPFPPPSGFGAAMLLSFRTEGNRRPISLLGLPQNASAALESSAIRAALATVRDAPAVPSDMPRFMSCFGPNLLVTWQTARRLEERGLFEMLRVRTKLDEQVSERVVGFFFTHDRHERQPCAVAGDMTHLATSCAAKRVCRIGMFEKRYLGRGEASPV